MDFSKIVQYDQLLREIRNHRSFVGFREGLISFPPTYRRDRKASRKFSNKRNQNPSYPDRVLWRSLPAFVKRLTQNEYWAAMNVLGSDHRPVAASFKLQLNPTVQRADRVSNRLIRKHNQVIGQRMSVLISRAMYVTTNHITKWRRYNGNVSPGSDISYQLHEGSISGPVPCVVCGRNIKISRQQFEIVRGNKREPYVYVSMLECLGCWGTSMLREHCSFSLSLGTLLFLSLSLSLSVCVCVCYNHSLSLSFSHAPHTYTHTRHTLDTNGNHLKLQRKTKETSSKISAQVC